MTNQDPHHVTFRFDDAKSFSENCDAFISSIEKIDAEMAAILRDNWDALVAIVREGERSSRARSHFNAAVASALDSAVRLEAHKGGA